MKFKLYTIDDRYIKYLKMYDKKVSHNYDHNVNKKPYVGIVYEDKDNHKFFAPLSSPKWIGNHFLDSQSTFFVIHRCRVI